MRFKSITTGPILWASILSLMFAWTTVRAEEIQLRDNSPDRYVVQKGDTLWTIAGKFLKDPWRWPDLWNLNRDQVKNPHWIYPGDVIALARVNGEWRLSLDRPVVTLAPGVRAQELGASAIPSIPPGDLEPYLTRPIVTGPDGFPSAAKIIAARDGRVIRGRGDSVYVVGVDEKAGNEWNIYRPGRILRSYDSDQPLGTEMHYLGSAKVTRFGEVSTVEITSAKEEIQFGDLLVPAPREELLNYAPHPPASAVESHVIDLAKNAAEAGRGDLVTLDRGTRDGIEIGHVLAIYHPITPIADPRPRQGPDVLSRMLDQTKAIVAPTTYLNIPPERSGLLFVFRVFDHVAYAIIVNSTEPIVVGDLARKP